MRVPRASVALAALAICMCVAMVPASPIQGCFVLDPDDGSTLFDLSPLNRDSTQPNWVATDSRENGKFTYFINVCGSLTSVGPGAVCKRSDFDGNTAACQALTNPNNATDADKAAFPKPMGTTLKSAVSVIDNEDLSAGVRLVYAGGKNNHPATSPTAKDGTCHGLYERKTEIRFTCGVGLGVPTFMGETADCTYIFVWKTSLVCEDAGSQGSVKCDLEDDMGNVYNLAPLIRSDSNWHAIDSRQNGAFSYSINVCRGLAPEAGLPAKCTASAETAACQTMPSDANFPNYVLGSVSSPQWDLAHGIMIRYMGGDKCHAGTVNEVARTVRIYFTCPANPAKGLGNPIFRTEIPQTCEYIFDWETTAACAVQDEVANDDCAVTDQFGNNFDLTPLAQFQYSTTDPHNKFGFVMSVCGSVQCGNLDGVSVCLSPEPQPSTPVHMPIGLVSKALEIENGDVSITYTSNVPCPRTPENMRSVLLSLYCDEFATPDETYKGFPKYVSSHDDCNYEFELGTSLLCPPSFIDCVFEAEGQTFDLTPLTKVHSSWEVADTRENGKFKYLLNVCKPVGDAPQTCPRGSAACQLDRTDPTFGKSLGLPSSPVFKDGKLSLKFTNGTVCHNNTAQQTQRSTHITFTCGPDLGEPKFVEELGDCSYLFEWRTSAACPVVAQNGSDCAVTDSVTHFTYDFSDLGDKEYTLTHDGEEYRMQLCDAAPTCGGRAGLCVKENGKWVPLGTASDSILLDDDDLSLTYENGHSCSDGTPSEVEIKFTCAPGLDGSDGPRIVDHDDGHCAYELEWLTNKACRSTHEPISCSVINPKTNEKYDLTRLMNSRANYQAVHGKDIYQVNICRPIVPIKGSTCPIDAAGCQLLPDRDDNSIGTPSAPKWDNTKKRVYLEYLNGTSGCHAKYDRTTRIDFICPEDETTQGEIRFLGESELDCKYLFEWVTPAACPVKLIKGEDCKVKDPLTGDMIDLSSLTRPANDPYVVNAAPYKYNINVCAAANCASTGAGACQAKPSDSTFEEKDMGKVNKELHFEDDLLTLTYTDGTPCRDNTFKRSTVIIFECDEAAGKGVPTFLEEQDSCTYVFQWKTALVCSEPIECRATDAKRRLQYDLSSLSNKDDNWVATDDREGGKYEYEFNVCRPLVPDPKQRWDCGPFTASCQKVKDEPDHELGFPDEPFVEADGSLVIVYKGGEKCHGVYERTTRIVFQCPFHDGSPVPGVLGTPSFLEETDTCEYIFQWETSAACPIGAFEPTDTGDCKATHPVFGDVYDLSSLSAKDLTVEVEDDDGSVYTYQVNVCGSISSSLSECSGAGACQLKKGSADFAKNMGQSNKKLVFDDNQLSLTYTDGAKCHETYQRETDITFRCDPAATTPKLVFLEETFDCIYRFEVLTSRVCRASKSVECAARDPTTGMSFDLSPLAKADGNWIAVSADKNSYIINVCRSLSANEDHCDTGFGACLVNRDGDTYSLGSVASPTVTDEGDLVILYEGGVCPTNRDIKSSVRIDFDCATTSSPPSLVAVTLACQYQFEWKTPLACPATTTTTAKPNTPEKVLPVDACRFTDASGAAFDLTPLSTQDFIAMNANKDESGMPYEYRLRACKSVSTCDKYTDAASCQKGGTSYWSLGKFTQAPVVQNNIITLTYTNAGSDKKCHNTYDRRTTITFRCDADVTINEGKGRPKYVGETSECVYEFEWATKYACPASEVEPIECVVRDPKTGEEYDLSVLARDADEPNWIARDSLAEDQADHYAFLINVCRPLSAVGTSNLGECVGAAACQTKPSDPDFKKYAIGHAKNEPRVLDSGDLVLEYELPANWPSKCHGSYVRRAEITFECKQGTLGEPVYIGETDDCIYQFTWETSAACSIREQVRGAMCKVRDPVSGMAFDLSPLAGKDHVVKDKGNTYTLSACGPIKASCKDGFESAGACQAGSQYGSLPLGKSNDNLIFFDGALSLEYVGGSTCHAGTEREDERSMFIEFVCDHDAGEGAPIFDYESGDCTYFFTWRTAYACAAKAEVQCLVVDPSGVEYDLSILTRTQGNWDVKNVGASDFEYVINVCHSINPASGVGNCSVNAAACQLKYGDSSFHKDLGHVLSAPRYDTVKKEIVLEYTSGDADGCPSARTTTIHFVCNDDPKTDFPLGQPVFTSERETCKYDITWKTVAACPVKDRVDQGCRITDPNTKQSYDLSALEPIEFLASDGATYRVSPCAELGKPCGADSKAAACQYAGKDKTPFSMGQSQGLQILGGDLYMKFVHGSKCGSDGKYEGSATVKFECGVPTGSGLRLAGKGVDCSYSFILRTPLVCPLRETVQCIVHDDKTRYTYDLSGLSVKDGSRTVKTDDGSSLDINVCAPVKKGSCPGNTGSCLTNAAGTSISAGSYEGSMPAMSRDNSKVELVYSNGGACPTGHGTAMTVIAFKCDKTPNQVPRFKTMADLTTNCAYYVEWPTCAVCPGDNPCLSSEPATTSAPGRTTKAPHTTTTRDPDSTSSFGDSKGKGNSPGVIVSLVVILSLVGIGGAYLVMKPETRVKLWRMVCSRSTYKPTYKYQKLDNEGGGASSKRELSSLVQDDSLSSDDSEELLPISKA